MALTLGIPGPVQVWLSDASPGPVGKGAGGDGFKFAGWTTGGVSVAFRNAYRPVMSDSHGSKEPYTQSYAGSDATISFRLRVGGGAFAEGAQPAFQLVDMGKSGKAVAKAMVILSPYKNATWNKHPTEYRFPRVYLNNADIEVSANGYVISATFRALPIIKTLYAGTPVGFQVHHILFSVTDLGALSSASQGDILTQL